MCTAAVTGSMSLHARRWPSRAPNKRSANQALSSLLLLSNLACFIYRPAERPGNFRIQKLVSKSKQSRTVKPAVAHHSDWKRPKKPSLEITSWTWGHETQHPHPLPKFPKVYTLEPTNRPAFQSAAKYNQRRLQSEQYAHRCPITKSSLA